MKKILVVYYSFSNGNTKRIAEQLQNALDADIARIETVVPYPPYTGPGCEVSEQGKDEVKRGFCPEIKPMSVDVDKYDVVAIGTPTWWYKMAPAVLTFVKAHDWTGKIVVPFMTNGGWTGQVIRDIKKFCAGAEFAPSMEVKFDSNGGANLETAQSEIDAWIDSVKKFVADSIEG